MKTSSFWSQRVTSTFNEWVIDYYAHDFHLFRLHLCPLKQEFTPQFAPNGFKVGYDAQSNSIKVYDLEKELPILLKQHQGEIESHSGVLFPPELQQMIQFVA